MKPPKRVKRIGNPNGCARCDDIEELFRRQRRLGQHVCELCLMCWVKHGQLGGGPLLSVIDSNKREVPVEIASAYMLGTPLRVLKTTYPEFIITDTCLGNDPFAAFAGR